MLTVQACQQYRLVVMQPNKPKSFPAATVSAAAKLVHRRRGKRGTRSEESRDARRAHASKQKCRRWRSGGVLGVLHSTRRKNEGKNLGRKGRSGGVLGVLHSTRRKNEGKNLGRKHLELSERRRACARKKRRGKRAGRKATRKKHKATRARSRLDELTFETFNVHTAAVNGANGIGHIDTLLRSCAMLRKVMTLLDCRRPKGTELQKSWRLVTAFFSAVIAAESKEEKGNMGLG